MLDYTTLHYTILYYTILYYTMRYYNKYTTLYYSVLYYTTPHYIILYYAILYILDYTILQMLLNCAGFSFLNMSGLSCALLLVTLRAVQSASFCGPSQRLMLCNLNLNPKF